MNQFVKLALVAVVLATSSGCTTVKRWFDWGSSTKYPETKVSQTPSNSVVYGTESVVSACDSQREGAELRPISPVELMKQTLKTWETTGKSLCVWWYPKLELVTMSVFRPGGPIPEPETLDFAFEMLNTLDEYTLMCASAFVVADDGSRQAVSREEMFSSIRLLPQDGAARPPVPEDQIPEPLS
jgi:hypothetical protein